MDFSTSPKSASAIAREARQSKGRNRHLPHQTDTLNEVFARTEHPSLQERTELAKRLDMETKVVNSWFQNKRASMRKKAQRVEPDTVPPPTLPVPSVATISASESLATDSDAPAFPSEPHHPSLPPRSHHPSLPPIANLLRGSPPHTMSGADSDAEDDNMAVQLPPIREDNFTRPAFLSPTLAAVCLPNALTASTAVMIHQPTSSPRYRRLPALDSHRSLSGSRAGSPYSNSSVRHSERLGSSSHPRSLSDTFPERSVRRYDPLGLSRSRHHALALPLIVRSEHMDRSTSQSSSTGMDSHLDVSVEQGSQVYSREQSQEVDELMEDFPSTSALSGSYKARRRPNPDQLEELRRTFENCTHPTRQERERLARVTGMRMQSISNWFQHQRSMARRRQSDVISDPVKFDRTDGPSSRAVSPSMSASVSARPRRSRPEAHQLDALKVLFAKTTTPSMEQRAALALEVNMTESKVTNWFRNARQTAKKKQSTAANESDMDAEDDDRSMDMDMSEPKTFLTHIPIPVSSVRSQGEHLLKPPVDLRRGGSHSADDMDVDDHQSTSHTGSDEDELVTPSPSSTTQPLYSPQNKNTPANVDDATLLLSLRAGGSP